jgi:hypothetical protein
MLYKYLSPARLDVIERLKIRFTQPAQLNDPFETEFLIDADTELDCNDIIETLSEEVLCETDEDRVELARAKAELREWAKEMSAPHVVGRRLAEFLNRAQGVLSLSRTNSSLLMWAHYGDSHRGYLLGLDETHPFFHKLNGYGQPTDPRNVIYTSRRTVAKARGRDFHDMLCYKSLEWAYEEEVRVLTTFKQNGPNFENNKLDEVHLFNLPKECIKEIYIGANASSKTRERILEAVDRRKIKARVFEAYVALDRYALEFRELSGLYSYKPGEMFYRSQMPISKQMDRQFAFNGLPVMITVDYGPGVLYPHYTEPS